MPPLARYARMVAKPGQGDALAAKMLDMATTADPEVVVRLTENALEDCVSAFDGFGRETYRVNAKTLSDPAKAETQLAEGIFTAPVLVEMAQDKGLEMPIARAVADILGGRISVDAAAEQLLTRPFRAEG